MVDQVEVAEMFAEECNLCAEQGNKTLRVNGVHHVVVLHGVVLNGMEAATW
jgi:hypothetical protein